MNSGRRRHRTVASTVVSAWACAHPQQSPIEKCPHPVTVTVASSSAPKFVPVETQAFNRQPWIEDYAALRSHLERAYSNLSWFASPEGGVDLPKLHARTQAALDSSNDAAEASAAINSFVSSFHDGHFSPLATGKPRPEGEKTRAPSAPPDRSLSPALGCSALGYVRTRGIAFSMRVDATPGFQLLSAGEPESLRSGVLKLANGRKVGVLRIPSFRNTEFVAECESAWRDVVRKNPSGPCDRNCTKALSHRVMELALVTLQKRLRDLARANVSAVIVDLGSNGGGNDLGDWMPRAFTAAPVRSARLALVRNAKSAAYFDEQLADLREALSVENLQAARTALGEAIEDYERLKALASSQEPCSMDWVWRERRPWAPLVPQTSCVSNLVFGKLYASGARDYLAPKALGSPKAEEVIYWPSIASSVVGSWTGPVYALIDGRTASSAEIAAAVLQDNQVAKLVGVKTEGLGCGFMYSGSEVTLPHSHLRFRVPNCIRLRADSTSEVGGIRPDIELPAFEGDSDLDRPFRLLELIERDLAVR